MNSEEGFIKEKIIIELLQNPESEIDIFQFYIDNSFTVNKNVWRLVKSLVDSSTGIKSRMEYKKIYISLNINKYNKLKNYLNFLRERRNDTLASRKRRIIAERLFPSNIMLHTLMEKGREMSSRELKDLPELRKKYKRSIENGFITLLKHSYVLVRKGSNLMYYYKINPKKEEAVIKKLRYLYAEGD